MTEPIATATLLAAVGILLALAFLARPIAVFAVPIVLATNPVLRGVPAGDQIFHLVFFVVLVNSLIPGATVAWLARRLGLAGALVRDLSLPEGCVVLLLVRGAEVIAPRGSTALLPGDEVCVFAIPSSRPLLDLLFGGALDDPS